MIVILCSNSGRRLLIRTTFWERSLKVKISSSWNPKKLGSMPTFWSWTIKIWTKRTTSFRKKINFWCRKSGSWRRSTKDRRLIRPNQTSIFLKPWRNWNTKRKGLRTLSLTLFRWRKNWKSSQTSWIMKRPLSKSKKGRISNLKIRF